MPAGRKSKRLTAKDKREWVDVEPQTQVETNNKLDQVLQGLASMNSRLSALEASSENPRPPTPPQTSRQEDDPKVIFHPRHVRAPSIQAESTSSKQQTAEAVARRMREFTDFNPLEDPALPSQGMTSNTGGGRHNQGSIQSGANITCQSRVVRDLHQEWPHTNLLGRNCSV